MVSLNKQLFFPSLVLCISLMGGTGLAYSSRTQETLEDNSLESWESLPQPHDRIVVVTPSTTDHPPVQADMPAAVSEVSLEIIQENSKQEFVEKTQALQQTTTSSEFQIQKKKQIEVTLNIQGPGISLKKPLSVESESTVYEVLKKASHQFDFSLKISQHTSLGAFVEGIAGTTNKPGSDLYWLYYLNGQFASKGVSSQVVSNGDVIKWIYE